MDSGSSLSLLSACSEHSQLDGFTSIITRASDLAAKGARVIIVHPSVHQSVGLCNALFIKDYGSKRDAYRAIKTPIIFVASAFVNPCSSVTLQAPLNVPLYRDTSDGSASSSESESSSDSEPAAEVAAAGIKRKRRGKHSISMQAWKRIVHEQTKGMFRISAFLLVVHFKY
jgi:hypothetical protein